MALVIRAPLLPERQARPHQVKALEWCERRNLIPLFMEMRTGKTLVTIRRFRRCRRILMVGPLSVLDDWQDELEAENERSRAVIAGSRRRRLETLGVGRKWNLTNFEAVNATPEILTEPWDCVIIDESPKIKNPQAKISKRMVKHFKRVPNKAILSGEPAPEGPMDYVMQYLFLYGNFMGFDNYWAVRNRACFLAGKFNWVVKPLWKKKIKDYIQSTAYVLSRKDAGLGNVKIYETRKIEQTPEQKRIAKAISEEFMLTTPDKEIWTKYVPVTWVWLAQLAGGFVKRKLTFPGKMRELTDIIVNEQRKNQVVVWFRFNQEVNKAFKILSSKGVSCARYTGAVNPSKRRERYQRFKRGEIRVLLCQQKVGLYGKDFSKASTSIYYSNGFSWEVRRQSEDRTENIAKKDSLLVIDLVSKGSMDEIIVRRLRKKSRQSQYYLRREIYEDIVRRAV